MKITGINCPDFAADVAQFSTGSSRNTTQHHLSPASHN